MNDAHADGKGWEDSLADEIGVGAPVTVPIDHKRIDGIVDALWIPASSLRAFANEVRVRVRVSDDHGRFWIGPHTLLERR